MGARAHRTRTKKTGKTQISNLASPENRGKQFTEILEREIIKLRDKKPDLFTITFQDQLNKLTGELATSIIRWLLN